ncbi:hypothetical protein ACFQ51_20690 [Streptomyces kaempferi]
MARLYVRETTGVEVVLHDTPSLSGAHDYDLVGNGEVAALEVSIWTDKAQMEAEKLQFENYARGRRFPALQHSWQVNVLSRTRFKGLSEKLIPHLQYLEGAGIRILHMENCPESLDSQVRIVGATLERLGVVSLLSFKETARNATIDIIPCSQSLVPFESNDALSLIESHMNSHATSDISKKLLRSGRTRRHAFLWADRAGCPTSWWGAGNLYKRLPTREPAFPDAVTDLWCVGGSGGWLWGKGKGGNLC